MTKRRNLDLSNAGSYFDSTGKLNLIAGTNVSISSTDSSFTISATDTNTTYTNVSEFVNDANYLDSTTVQGVIDASYIQANQTTYANVSEFVNDANYLDSTTVQGVIDATYIQANQTTYSNVSEFANDAQYLDSTTVQGVIDATYIQSNQTTYNTSDFLDSTTVALVVDAAYVQARQTTYSTADFLDSTYALALFSGGTGVTYDGAGEFSIGQAVGTSDDVVFNNMVVSGNLTVNGTTTTINSTTVSVNDKNIVLADSAADATAADSSGITVAGAGATILYKSVGDKWVFNKAPYYNAARVLTTDDEGTGNGLDADTLDGQQGSYYLDADNFTNKPNAFGNIFVSGQTTVSADSPSDVLTFTGNNGINITTDAGGKEVNISFVNTAQYLDSTTVQGVIDATYVQNNQITYNTSDFPDSAIVISLITANETTYTNVSEFINDANYLDSTTVQGVINSGYIQSNQITYNTSDFLDSTTVALVVDAAYVQARQTTYNTSDFLDSTTVAFVIDGPYIQARQTTYSTADFLDSTYAIALIDSAYIEARRPAETIFGVVNNGTSAYTFSGDGFPSTVDNPTLYLARGKTYKFSVNASGHPFQIRVSDGGSAYSNGVTNNGAQVGDVIFTVPMNAPNSLVYQCTVHSGMVGNIVIFNENSFLDSSTVTGVINASYIQANQITYNTADFPDSAGVITLIAANETTYTNVSEFINDANYLDSTTVQGVIDATYIQSNQTTYSTADFLDSYYATALIDSAYIQLRQAGGTDPIFKSIAVAGQDSIVADGTTDILTIAAGTGISITTNASTDTLTITATGGGGGSGTLDSTTVLDVIDGHLNTGTAGVGEVLSWTGSDYDWVAQSGGSGGAVGLTVDNYKYTATSGQTSFSGSDIAGNSLAYTADRIQVFRNGVLLTDSDDYTATNGTTVVLASGADSNDAIVISAFKGVSSLDSAGIISLIAANETTYTNVSEFVNDANYLDSTTVQGVVNASYIQSNQTTYNTSDFPDSAGVITLIGANETTYTNVSEFINDANYLDSTTVQGVIDSDYVSARSGPGFDPGKVYTYSILFGG